MLTGNSDIAWELYGKQDPYFGVCTEKQFQTKNLSEDALKVFFQSGETHITSVFHTIQKYLDPSFQPKRALDFGCGVGRLTIPLSKLCPQVVGVDVSVSMLDTARKHCERVGTNNIDFVLSDDGLTEVTGSFDLINSFTVFQHIPSPRGEVILQAMIDRLSLGGVGVLHFTYARQAPAVRKIVHWMRKSIPLVNNLVNLLQGESFFYPMMQMNQYDLNRLFQILQEQHCKHMYVQFTDHGGHLGAIFFFQKQAASTEYVC